MMLPISQQTFTYNDILKIVNEEMMINAVPQVKLAHEEYFVYDVYRELVNGIGKYEIPSRAIGMALRDLNWIDQQGNFNKMTRIAADDRAFFQSGAGGNQLIDKYYLQGNEIILNQQVNIGATGNLNFSIFLRPNYLVRNNRACTIQNFIKDIEIINNSLISNGDQIIITSGIQTQSPLITILTAVTGSPLESEFLIGANASATAANLATTITNLNLEDVNISVSGATVSFIYEDITTTFEYDNISAFSIDNDNTYIQFDQLPSTYIDPDTNVTSDLYMQNSLVDFLQTNPGHRTYTFDIKLKQILSGNIGKFLTNNLKTYMNNVGSGVKSFYPIKIGDYICLANECIIPQIPPELHYALAERAASFIMKAMGDKDGYATSQNTIQQMNNAQATLIDSRIEGSVPKVFNQFNLLRLGKKITRRRW